MSSPHVPPKAAPRAPSSLNPFPGRSSTEEDRPQTTSTTSTTTILSPTPTRPEASLSSPNIPFLTPPTPPPLLSTADPSSSPDGLLMSIPTLSSSQSPSVSTGTDTLVAQLRKTRRRTRSLRKAALLKPPQQSPPSLHIPSAHNHNHKHTSSNEAIYFSDSSSASPPLSLPKPSPSHTPSHSRAPSLDRYGYLPPPGNYDSAGDMVFYGWVVLLSTWAVFVVGMGSVFGVWDWAWDVDASADGNATLGKCATWVREHTGGGEWEEIVRDDEELPIHGYYPALIVLTAVMAWVWVVVAWVGLKYFKHAKIQAPRAPEDGE